jgi:hypothetical protein
MLGGIFPSLFFAACISWGVLDSSERRCGWDLKLEWKCTFVGIGKTGKPSAPIITAPIITIGIQGSCEL